MDPLKRVTPIFYLAIILLNFTHNTYASTTQDFPVPPDIANANKAVAATTSYLHRPHTNMPKVPAINPNTIYCSAVIL